MLVEKGSKQNQKNSNQCGCVRDHGNPGFLLVLICFVIKRQIHLPYVSHFFHNNVTVLCTSVLLLYDRQETLTDGRTVGFDFRPRNLKHTVTVLHVCGGSNSCDHFAITRTVGHSFRVSMNQHHRVWKQARHEESHNFFAFKAHKLASSSQVKCTDSPLNTWFHLYSVSDGCTDS